MFELEIRFQGEPVRSFHVGARPVILGRDPGTDIPVGDTSVSRRHAMFFVEGGRLFVRDLGSSNGTWVRNERVVGAEPVAPGDDLRIGADTTVTVRPLGEAVGPATTVLVEDVATGWALPVGVGELTFGNDAHAWWWLPDPDGPSATLRIGEDGGATLERPDGAVPVRLGDAFEIGSRSFRLTADTGDTSTAGPTSQPGRAAFGYRLEVGFRTSGEAWAELVADPAGRSYRVNSGNKAILLYLLGRPFADPETCRDGWVSDDTILTGIWGRSGDANKLYVLLHRLRADLGAAGLDPACVEKRTGMTRLRIRGGEVKGYD